MNSLKGTIGRIESENALSILEIRIDTHVLHAVVIETAESAEWLRTGRDVEALFKETQVLLLPGDSSTQRLLNTLECTVEGLERGKVFCRIFLRFLDRKLTVVIPTLAWDRLDIKTGDTLTAYLQPNEIMIAPC